MYQPKMCPPLHQEQKLPRKHLERRSQVKIDHDPEQDALIILHLRRPEEKQHKLEKRQQADIDPDVLHYKK